MDGWTSHVDPKTKRMYYHHAESNKTQWTTPNDIPSNKKTPSLQDLKRKTLPPCATASVMKLDAILSDLPHAKTECTWKKYWNTEYDRYYYHHASKDITTWTKPKEYEEDDLFVALPTELVSEKIKQEKKDAAEAMEKIDVNLVRPFSLLPNILQKEILVTMPRIRTMSRSKNGQLQYETFMVSDAVIQINKSIYPDEVTEDQMVQLMDKHVIPLIRGSEDESLMLPCLRCKTVKYCSRQCQSDDWGSHYNRCMEISAEEREANLKAIGYREPGTEVITTDGMKRCLVEQPEPMRFFNVQIEAKTVQVSSTTLTAAYLVNSIISHFDSFESIQDSIRIRHMPDATFDELVEQAEVHIASRSYSQAVQCLTRALLKNDVQSKIFLTTRANRMKLANTITRKIWCQVQGEEGREHHDLSRLELLRKDCAFLLDTGIFDLNELGSIFAQKVNGMDNQAKAWREELAVEGVDDWIPQPMITARRQSRNNSSRKKKKSNKKSKATTRSFQLYPCSALIEHIEVKNASSDQDYCPSCQTQWNHFIEPCYAVVLPCLHAMCCTCLIKFQNGCKQTFDTEVDEDVQVAFVCALCREKLNPNLSSKMAKVMIAKSDAIPSYTVFMRTVHFEDSRAADAMILHLLVQHEFNLSKVGDALFNMIGLLVNDDINGHVELIPDEKQDIYLTARAPVRALEGEIRKVRDRYNAHWKATNQEKRKFLHTLKCLKERLAKARENAASDIFERMNASGGMGSLSGDTLLKIDIHGLHVEEAKTQITEYVLPVLQVVSKVILITGRGRHGASGASILKPAMESFLSSMNVKFRDVPRNDGAIWMYS